MLNYKKMTAKEAIRAAKEESGLTAEQIARRLNVSTSVIRRYLKEDDNYFPGLEMLPRLCLVLGNSLLLDWATAQIKQEDDEQREKNACISDKRHKRVGRGTVPYHESGNSHLLGGRRNTSSAGRGRSGMQQDKRSFATEKMRLRQKEKFLVPIVEVMAKMFL